MNPETTTVTGEQINKALSRLPLIQQVGHGRSFQGEHFGKDINGMTFEIPGSQALPVNGKALSSVVDIMLPETSAVHEEPTELIDTALGISHMEAVHLNSETLTPLLAENGKLKKAIQNQELYPLDSDERTQALERIAELDELLEQYRLANIAPEHYLNVTAFGGFTLPSPLSPAYFDNVVTSIHSANKHNEGIGPFATQVIPEPLMVYPFRSSIESNYFRDGDEDSREATKISALVNIMMVRRYMDLDFVKNDGENKNNMQLQPRIITDKYWDNPIHDRIFDTVLPHMEALLETDFTEMTDVEVYTALRNIIQMGAKRNGDTAETAINSMKYAILHSVYFGDVEVEGLEVFPEGTMRVTNISEDETKFLKLREYVSKILVEAGLAKQGSTKFNIRTQIGEGNKPYYPPAELPEFGDWGNDSERIIQYLTQQTALESEPRESMERRKFTTQRLLRMPKLAKDAQPDDIMLWNKELKRRAIKYVDMLSEIEISNPRLVAAFKEAHGSQGLDRLSA